LEFDNKSAACSRNFKASAIVSAVTASENPAIVPTKTEKKMIMANSTPPHDLRKVLLAREKLSDATGG
jgi:hypothetical protein